MYQTNPYQNFLNQTSPNQYQQATQMNQATNNFNPVQPQATRQEIIQVNGLDGAKAYQMQPNSQIILLDLNNPTVYIKQTDGANFPTITTYQLIPVETVAAEEKGTNNNIELRLKKLEEFMGELTNEQSVIEQPKPSGKSNKRINSASTSTSDATT